MKLKDEIEAFVSVDPMKSVRQMHGALLVQSVGALLTAGASPAEIVECVQQALVLAGHGGRVILDS